MSSKETPLHCCNFNWGVSYRWLDETPTARVITRCTQDIRAVDGPVPEAIASLTNTGITMLTKLVVIIIFTPIFLSPTLAIAVLGFCLGNFYLRAQLSAKREMRYVDTSDLFTIDISFTYVVIQQCAFPRTGSLWCRDCGSR